MGRRVWLIGWVLALSLPMFSYAGEVVKVKNKAVLLNLDGEGASVGDTYFLLNSSGKKKAIVKITKVKGDQAIGHLAAGKAEAGMTLLKRSGGGSSASSSRRSNNSNSQFLRKKSYWGVMLGLNDNMMSVDLPSPASSTVALSGISFGLTGIFDYDLWQRVWFRGGVGYQGFSGTGPADCSGNSACNVNISYLDFSFLGRYLFTENQIRPWLGAGMDMLFPAAKSSTALDSSSIATTFILVISGGVDWSISQDMYIPISIEYGYFPKSQQVGAEWFALRAGVAWPF